MSEADAFDLHAALLITLDHARYSLGFCNITQHRQRVCWVTMCWCKMVFFSSVISMPFWFYVMFGTAFQHRKCLSIQILWYNGIVGKWALFGKCIKWTGPMHSAERNDKVCSRKFNGRNDVGLAGTNESIRLFSPHTHKHSHSHTHKHSQTLTNTHRHPQTLTNTREHVSIKILGAKIFRIHEIHGKSPW